LCIGHLSKPNLGVVQMSVKALTWAFDQPISATEKVVLLALADHANDRGECWPSVSLLMQRAYVGERTVQRSLQSLENSGFIVRERRQRENGSDTSNLYRLIFTKVSQGVSAGISGDQRGSGGVNLAPHPNKEGVTLTGGEGVIQTGGGGGLYDTPRTVRKNRKKEPPYISVDADFDAFWAAYPKRPNNPKAPAKKSYIAARRGNVSHEAIMAGVNAYAAMRVNEDPKFTAQAVTWLNQKRWADEYDVPAEAKPVAQASDGQLDTLAAVYPGHIGDRDRAKKLLAVELSKGISLNEFCVAADKYKLFCKGPPYEDRRVTPSMLEPWLQFKWREMDAYEFCKVGADRIRTVRPIKVKT
jgi:hypothetical protein